LMGENLDLPMVSLPVSMVVSGNRKTFERTLAEPADRQFSVRRPQVKCNYEPDPPAHTRLSF